MEYWKQELYHHGILGMKWGKRNGPPYPLSRDGNGHTAEERKVGWQKSKLGKRNTGLYDRNEAENARRRYWEKKGYSNPPSQQKIKADTKTQNNKTRFNTQRIGSNNRVSLTPAQKKALAIAVVASISGYALYKSGALDSIISSGKDYILNQNQFSGSFTVPQPNLLRNIKDIARDITDRDMNLLNRISENGKIDLKDATDFDSYKEMLYNYGVNNLTSIDDFTKIGNSGISAITKYTGASYEPINKYLRGITKFIDEKDAQTMDLLTRALNQMTIPKDTITSRAINHKDIWKMLNIDGESITNISDLKGATFTEKGFFSSMLGSKSTFTGDVQLHTMIPSGSKGAFVSPISLFKSELEVLLQQGSTFKITDVKADSFGKITDLTILLVNQI